MAFGVSKNGFDTSINVRRAEKLFAEYGEFIRSVIFFNSINHDLSEDLFHDLFLHFVAKPIPQNIKNMEGFLYKVVTDEIKDSYRRIKRYHARIQRYAAFNPNITVEPPDKEFINLEETKKMFELIQKNLSTKEAIAVKLRYRDDHDTKIVAQKMGIKSRSVSRYISIGIGKLRKIIGEYKGNSYDSH